MVLYISVFKEFSEKYHTIKSEEAAKVDSTEPNLLFGEPSPRQLIRSNSIQEELLTTF